MEQDTQSHAIPETITNRAFLVQFTRGDVAKQQKYIGMFLDNAPQLLLKLEQAMKDGDPASVKIAAHSLKPQLGYMGVKEEISNILLIEQTAGGAGHADRLPDLVDQLRRVCKQAFEELRA